MGPAFVDVFDRVDSITNYQPPEILPNGDILIRRNPDAPAWPPAESRRRRIEPEPRTPERSDPGEAAPWTAPACRPRQRAPHRPEPRHGAVGPQPAMLAGHHRRARRRSNRP